MTEEILQIEDLDTPIEISISCFAENTTVSVDPKDWACLYYNSTINGWVLGCEVVDINNGLCVI